MHLESHGIETGDRHQPFLARVTIGTRNRQETMVEFAAPTLAAAQQQADDWLHEYSARLGLGDADLLRPSAMRARWARLHEGMPKLPEPREQYCAALERMGDDEEVVAEEETASPSRRRRTSGYAHRSKIVGAVASARAAGLDVASIRVWPDGSIAVFDSRCGAGEQPITGESAAYDEWKKGRP